MGSEMCIRDRQYLQVQLAELQDLKEQLAVVNKKKSTTKVVLYVSAGAMAAGPILSLITAGANFSDMVMSAFLKVESRQDLLMKYGVQAGLVILGAGTIGTVSSGGYLIYLNMTQANQLEKQIAQLEADIQTTASQLK